MIILLLGLVCFVAALRIASERSGLAPGERVRGPAAAAWLGLVALLTLGQLWVGRHELERWRLSLLGMRYRIVDASGSSLPGSLAIGGDEASADLWVPGAGDVPVAAIRPLGEDALLGVGLFPAEDAGAVALVEETGALASAWRVLGAAPVGPGDTVEVRSPGGAYRLALDEVPGSVAFFDADVPLPWIRDVRVSLLGAGGDVLASVSLPAVEGSTLRRLRGFRPSVFQRTYPLADVVAALEDVRSGGEAGEVAVPPLGSFLFFEDGALHLADLDREVSVSGVEGGGALPLWSPEDGGRRILVAGLPHRDYPEPDLRLPERYGIRPLRSWSVSVSDGWLDVALGSPEIRSLDRAALERLDLAGGPDGEGTPVYRVRLASARADLARQAVTFDGIPRALSVETQAVFRLPVETTASEVGVLAPSGLAVRETGRPMALGAGDRRVVVRLDGQGTSAAFWLVHLAILSMVGLVFLRRPMTGPVFALALTVAGMAGLRLVLGVSALAAYPFVQEAQQIGLWVLALLPWAVVLAGEVGASGASPAPPGGATWRARTFHLAYALAVAGLAVALFAGAPAKQAVLAAVPLGLFACWAASAGGWRPWEGIQARLERAALTRPRLWGGWALGLGMLLLRAFLESLGWREQLTLGGTRIGVSVIYTPLVVLALAALLHLHGRRLRDAGPDAFAATAGAALLDLGGFLVLALVAVSGWVSDFGIALVLLPGTVCVLAVLGHLWAPAGRGGRAAAVAFALPLALFVLLQAAPPLLGFAWGGEPGAGRARMEEWNRNELLLLERGDPAALRMIGERRSEALAVMRETMRSYTRGNPWGKGFLQGRVSDEIVDTAVREHAVGALLASQFGLPGVLGLVLLLGALLPPVTALVRSGSAPSPRRGREGPRQAAPILAACVAALALIAYLLPPPFNAVLVAVLVLAGVVVSLGPRFGVVAARWWGMEAGDGAPPGADRAGVDPAALVAMVALYVVAFAGLYMVLANYGLVFFTGKNVYLLGLDSVGDALETLAVTGTAAVALGLAARNVADGGAGEEGAVVVGAGDEWWRTDRDEETTA